MVATIVMPVGGQLTGRIASHWQIALSGLISITCMLFASFVPRTSFLGFAIPFVGGMAEDLFQVNIVGELFSASIADQLIRIRNGDRFWFERKGVLTEEEKLEVQTTNFKDIIIRNTGLKIEELGEASVFALYKRRCVFYII